MKRIRSAVMDTFSTFTVLSFLFGILCKAGVLESLPYSEVVFMLLGMSAGTSVFVALREWLLPDAGRVKYGIEIFGCTVIILLSLHFGGWLELRLTYFLLVFAMVLVVYLVVWALTWLQCKHDEEDLNALLEGREGKHSGTEDR